MEVMHYQAADGRDPFQEWLDGLRDLKARVAVLRRVDRLANDNFGDHKFCRDGVWELRIDVGPGYRVYYAIAGKRKVVLLCGGSKGRQSSDIATAVEFWRDYQQRQS